ncbi:hypothetical protein CGMCC3_g9650 [Colletotrichum fructicola]|nr:uncharacterized protein CGMCC3_g9650 [Colletotrichum fructicola]KAE9574423.1 hypothetical protein CGMCC3_g9650 [Colletotrichum fructicola]
MDSTSLVRQSHHREPLEAKIGGHRDGMWEFLKQKAVLPTAEIFSEYEGNLTLVVGAPPRPDNQSGQDTLFVPTKQESRRFRVDSKTMATVSDVFDCMLFGGFAENPGS